MQIMTAVVSVSNDSIYLVASHSRGKRALERSQSCSFPDWGLCVPGRNVTTTAPVKMTHLYMRISWRERNKRSEIDITERGIIKNKYIEVYREISAITLLILKQSRLDIRF